MILDILREKLGLNARETQAVDQWLKNIQRDGYTLSNQSTTTGNSRGVQAGNIQISLEEGITLRNPSSGARTVYLDPDGDAWFGKNIDLAASTSLSIFSNDQNYNTEVMGEGDVLLGDNSTGKGNMFWDASLGTLNIRSGVTNSVVIGAGGIVVDWATIGGWSIDATRIYKTGIILDSANDKITVGASAPNIILDGANKVIKSSNFSEDAAGFQLSAVSGDAEFNNIVARGSFRTSVFTYENILAIGGHLVVSKSAAEVNTDVTTAATFTLVVKADDSGGALVASGDILEIKGWNGTSLIDVYVTAGAVTTAGGTCSFTATLNSGGTGVALQRGMGVVNLGPSGSGLIKLQAGDLGDATIPTRLAIQTHAGAPWTTLATKVVLGDMYNTYGAGANHRYGIGIGDFSSGNYLSYNAEAADTFRIWAGNGGLSIDASGIKAWTAGAATVHIDTDGDAFFGSNVGSASDTAFAVFANAQTYNTEAMGAGDVLLGDNSTSKANVLWDKSTGKMLFRGGKVTQAYVDTDGSIKAGGGKVVIDSAGLNLWQNGGASETRIRWRYDQSGTTRILGGLYAKYAGSGVPETWLYSYRATGDPWSSTKLILGALDAVGGTDAVIYLDSSGVITLAAPTVHVSTGDLYTDTWTDYSGTSTIVGWASFTEKAIEYKKIGKLVFVNFRIGGTSNSTSTSFTVPYPEGHPAGNPIFMFRANNNSAIAIAFGQFTAASTVTFYSTAASAFWNGAAVIKTIHGQFWYQTT